MRPLPQATDSAPPLGVLQRHVSVERFSGVLRVFWREGRGVSQGGRGERRAMSLATCWCLWDRARKRVAFFSKFTPSGVCHLRIRSTVSPPSHAKGFPDRGFVLLFGDTHGEVILVCRLDRAGLGGQGLLEGTLRQLLRDNTWKSLLFSGSSKREHELGLCGVTGRSNEAPQQPGHKTRSIHFIPCFWQPRGGGGGWGRGREGALNAVICMPVVP